MRLQSSSHSLFYILSACFFLKTWGSLYKDDLDESFPLWLSGEGHCDSRCASSGELGDNAAPTPNDDHNISPIEASCFLHKLESFPTQDVLEFLETLGNNPIYFQLCKRFLVHWVVLYSNAHYEGIHLLLAEYMQRLSKDDFYGCKEERAFGGASTMMLEYYSRPSTRKEIKAIYDKYFKYWAHHSLIFPTLFISNNPFLNELVNSGNHQEYSCDIFVHYSDECLLLGEFGNVDEYIPGCILSGSNAVSAGGIKINWEELSHGQTIDFSSGQHTCLSSNSSIRWPEIFNSSPPPHSPPFQEKDSTNLEKEESCQSKGEEFGRNINKSPRKIQRKYAKKSQKKTPRKSQRKYSKIHNVRKWKAMKVKFSAWKSNFSENISEISFDQFKAIEDFSESDLLEWFDLHSKEGEATKWVSRDKSGNFINLTHRILFRTSRALENTFSQALQTSKHTGFTQILYHKMNEKAYHLTCRFLFLDFYHFRSQNLKRDQGLTWKMSLKTFKMFHRYDWIPLLSQFFDNPTQLRLLFAKKGR